MNSHSCVCFAHLFSDLTRFLFVGIPRLLGKWIFPKAVYFASIYRYIQIGFNKTSKQSTCLLLPLKHKNLYHLKKYIEGIQKIEYML